MNINDFNFELPAEQIAQRPLDKRDASRLMVLDRRSGRIEHRRFLDLSDLLRPSDLLVALGRDLAYLQPVDCPCGRLASSRWELSLPTSEMSSLLGRRDVAPLSVAARSRAGRVKVLRLGHDPMDAATFRQLLGYSRLKSLWFDVVDEGRDGWVKISGHGYGHGAGLCQWGAKLHAESGWNYRQILQHYYPGTELQRMY